MYEEEELSEEEEGIAAYNHCQILSSIQCSGWLLHLLGAGVIQNTRHSSQQNITNIRYCHCWLFSCIAICHWTRFVSWWCSVITNEALPCINPPLPHSSNQSLQALRAHLSRLTFLPPFLFIKPQHQLQVSESEWVVVPRPEQQGLKMRNKMSKTKRKLKRKTKRSKNQCKSSTQTQTQKSIWQLLDR